MAGQKTDQRDVHVGQRIAEQRRKASLTQRKVAQSFGMSAAQLQKYEKGTNRISAVHLDIFSRMTGVPLEYFFKGMPRTDDGAEGLAEAPQRAYEAGESWQDMADTVARQLNDRCSAETRREIAAMVQALGQRLGD